MNAGTSGAEIGASLWVPVSLKVRELVLTLCIRFVSAAVIRWAKLRASPSTILTSSVFAFQSTGWYVSTSFLSLVFKTCSNRGRESGGDAWKQYMRWSACTSTLSVSSSRCHVLTDFDSKLLKRSSPRTRSQLQYRLNIK